MSINLNDLSGRFNPNPSPNSVTQCKKDTSTNGSRVCSSLVPNNCQGGFRLGGNCNGQQRLDITRLPQSEFQMGDDQVRSWEESDWRKAGLGGIWGSWHYYYYRG